MATAGAMNGADGVDNRGEGGRMGRRALLLRAASAGAAALLAGCGGGGESPGGGAGTDGGAGRRGRVTVRIDWPAEEKTRLIPAFARSVKVRVFSPARGIVTAEAVAPRPPAGGTSTLSFEDLEPEPVQLTATAHPDEDGGGVAQATGTVAVTVPAGGEARADIVMDSTIVRVTLGGGNLLLGTTRSLVATAYDSADRVVLVGPEGLRWQSTQPGVVSVAERTGAASALAPGTARVTAADPESGVSGEADYEVTDRAIDIPERFDAVFLGTPPGFVLFEPRALNDRGQVVGSARVQATGGNGPRRAFLWDAGAWTQLSMPPDAVEAVAYDIDNQGRIVGALRIRAIQANEQSTAYLPARWDTPASEPVALLPANPPFLPFHNVGAHGINGQGEAAMIGLPTPNSGPLLLLWRPAAGGGAPTVTTLTNALPNEALPSINNAGQVASSVPHSTFDGVAAVWDPGSAQPRILPLYLTSSGIGTRATALNDRGDVVGYSGTRGGGLPLYWGASATVVTQIIPWNAGHGGVATGINEAGLVVGDLQGHPQNHGAFLWKPDAGPVVPLVSPIPDWQTGHWRVTRTVGINRGGRVLCVCAFNGGQGTGATLLVPR